MSGADGERGTIRRIGVREFRNNMGAVLREARSGRSFVGMARDDVLAEIHPASKAVRLRRRSGALRGEIDMAEDFDVLPPAVLAAMEGEET